MKTNTVILDTTKNQPSGLHFTINHTGKMSGLHSLSTSCKVNKQCLQNSKVKNSICSKCFAAALLKRYSNMEECLQRNYEILTGRILDWDEIPFTTTLLFRFESFGDIANWVQVANFFNIAKKNPRTLFALWTKNPRHIAEAINKGYNKPQNLQIVYSSLFIDTQTKAPEKYTFIDKIFTVYSKEENAPKGINCGARSCFACKRCYLENPKGEKIQHIAELLK